MLDNNNVVHAPESSIRKAIRQNKLGATNTSQWFYKTGLDRNKVHVQRKDKEQKVCVYVRRSVLEEELLKKLDKGVHMHHC